jgi:penicillin-binding protein 1A
MKELKEHIFKLLETAKEKLFALLRKIRNNPRKFFRFGLFAGAAGIAAVVLLWIGMHLTVWLGMWGPLPTVEELAGIENHNSSEIYASGGEMLGKFYIYDRSSIGLQEIAPEVVHALIATEDVRFYQHRGTDLRSMARVVVKNLLMGDRSAGGGSTINRQLSKNLFPRERKGLFGLVVEKIREGIIARRLERAYTKDEILVLYLNTVPFGDNVFGIAAASQRFFNKHPRHLNTEEAAVLIGMLKATSSFNPRINPDRALLRRNVVLQQMRKYEYLEPAIADSLLGLPLQLDYSPMTHIHGPAPYFREMLRVNLVRWLNEFNEEHETSYNLYTDGLKIFTTIDFDLQLMAEQAIREEMTRLQQVVDRHYRNVQASRVQALVNREMQRSPRYFSLQNTGMQEAEILKNFETPVAMRFFSWEDEETQELSPLDSILKAQTLLHAGLVSLEPSTGHIRAWVGGNNFRFFQFDQVLSPRQAGSAFKPFVYAAALEAGVDPCEFISNESFVLEAFDDWSPANIDDNYEGYYSMKGAMTHSINTVSTHYLLRAGLEPVIRLARDAGINATLPAVPSLGLGSGEVNMLEMAVAYSIFPNNGVPVNPQYLTRIEDARGNILFEAPRQVSRDPVISESTALLMTDILRSVVNQGTAASLRSAYSLPYDMAGKTGTTQNNADGWFVGYTHGLVTAVWTGLDQPLFARTYPLPFGASRTALPVWGSYMAKAGRNPNTRAMINGPMPTLTEDLAALLRCPLYLEVLEQPSWLERLFGAPPQEREPREVSPRREPRQREPERRSRLRRWLEEIF